MPKIGKGMKIWAYFFVYALLLIIPNSTYAMFEIRHVLFLDNIADNPNIWSFLVFGGISLFGLLTTLYGIRLITDYYAKSKRERVLYGSILSIFCGIGAVVGLLDFASMPAIIFPPVLYQAALMLFSQPTLLVIGLACAIFIFLMNILVDKIFKPPHVTIL